MDDLLPIILFFIFVIAPLLEKVRGKGGKVPPTPPPRRPQQRPRPEYTEPRGTTVLTGGTLSQPRTGEDQSAAEMLPDDLWEILTGQQRPRPSLPQPTQTEYGEADEDDEELEWEQLPDEETLYEQRRLQEERERQERERITLARRNAGALSNTAERAPVVVSMEPTAISSARRHADYHARSLPPAPKVQRGTSALPHPLLLGSPEEMRRAVLLQEILGKPKGLED